MAMNSIQLHHPQITTTTTITTVFVEFRGVRRCRQVRNARCPTFKFHLVTSSTDV